MTNVIKQRRHLLDDDYINLDMLTVSKIDKIEHDSDEEDKMSIADDVDLMGEDFCVNK